MSRLLSAYASITNAGTPVLEWLLKRRLQKGKEDPVRLDERRGLASLPRPQEAGLRLLWVHAASVGESQAALILIESLKAYNIRILVTTGTVTSASLMERRLPDYAFHQYIPVDHPLWVERFLNHWKPDLAFWMESELWPNMLLALKKRGTPAVLLNARMSNTSFNRWRYAPKAARAILESFVQIQAQTENDAARFRLFGHRNVSASGNIKFSAAPLPYDEIAFSAMQL
ncbi:MAG: glycosyltransferase N-terminal domain-containing protein, partial [Micavibrio sp.]